jgi:hypothetical protein
MSKGEFTMILHHARIHFGEAVFFAGVLTVMLMIAFVDFEAFVVSMLVITLMPWIYDLIEQTRKQK